jgi:hypothetical protein
MNNTLTLVCWNFENNGTNDSSRRPVVRPTAAHGGTRPGWKPARPVSGT